MITGTPDQDVIAGLGGNDTIIGGGGSDLICGGRGNDKITAEDGPTGDYGYIRGGPGDDDLLVIANNFGGHDIAGGPGNDRIDCGDEFASLSYFTASAGVVVDLEAGTARGGAGRDTLVRCRGELSGSPFADVLRGTRRGDILDGWDGDDRLVGRGGNDHLDGGRGDDVLDGGVGKDQTTFAFYPRPKGVVVIDLRRGQSSGREPGIGNDRLQGIEIVFGGHGPDVIIGSAGPDVLIGDDGDDRLFGGGGNDTLKGQRGRDTLNGGPGRDMGDGGRAEGDSCVSLELRRRCD